MSISWLAVVLVCLPIAQGEKPTHPRADWLKQDLKTIELFRAVTAAQDLDVETLIAKFGRPDEHADRDIGFGARRTHLHLYGGYTTIWVDILSEQGEGDKKSRVAELRARQSGSNDHWASIEPEFRKAWDGAATSIENGFEFTRRDAALAQSLRARTAEALGVLETPIVPKELQNAYALLTSPFEDVILGRSYSIDGGPPPGLTEIEQLVKAGRYDLVRAVQRGINPEARLYAIWALRENKTALPTKADGDATAKLLALPGALHTTEGCTQIWRSPAEALQFLLEEN